MSELSTPPDDFQGITTYQFRNLTPDILSAEVDKTKQSIRLLAETAVTATEEPTPGVFETIDRIMDVAGYEGDYGRILQLLAAVHPDADIRVASAKGQGAIQSYMSRLFAGDSTEEDPIPNIYTPVAAHKEQYLQNGSPKETETDLLIAATLADFERNGQGLEAEKKARVQELLDEINTNCNAFLASVRNDTTTLPFTKAQLTGMPDGFFADSKKYNQHSEDIYGVKVTDYDQIMKFATDRRVRRAVWVAKNSVGTIATTSEDHSGEMNTNKDLILKIIQARDEVAHLLQYPSWADLQLKNTMAGSLEAVEAFYNSLKEPLLQKVAEEIAPMQELLAADGFEGVIQAWDTEYYAEKIRQRDYNVDSNKIAEYFPLEDVLKGLFNVTGDMYELDIVELTEQSDTNSWHEDVRYFGIRDRATGKALGTFYMDLFERQGKIKHPGVTFTLQFANALPDGERQQSVSAYVTNLSKPSDGKPCLLQPNEIKTMFHEFGHVLHTALAQEANTVRFAGTKVLRDFVEARSRLKEYMAFSKLVLERIGNHYQTGEKIPDDMINNLIASQNVTVGLKTIRDLQLGLFDLAVHDRTQVKDLAFINRAEKDAAAFSGTPDVPGTSFASPFMHPFGGGYDAVYHAYLWSLVRGDTMLGYMLDRGILQAGMEYREAILAPGGSRSPEKSMQMLLGPEANVNSTAAFLSRLALRAS